MCKIISVVSCKGGVGKTTSAVNISSYMQMQGKKVCAVDLDPQHNLSKHFGIHPGHLVDRPTIYNLLNAAIEDTEDDEMDKLVKESIIHSTTVDVDSGKIGFKVAVNVSYLTVETQEYLLKSIIPSGIKLKSEQISELRRLEDCGSLNPKMIQSVFCSKTKLIPGSITISGKKLMEYADILATTDNIEFLFFEFLKEYRKSVQRT